MIAFVVILSDTFADGLDSSDHPSIPLSGFRLLIESDSREKILLLEIIDHILDPSAELFPVGSFRGQFGLLISSCEGEKEYLRLELFDGDHESQQCLQRSDRVIGFRRFPQLPADIGCNIPEVSVGSGAEWLAQMVISFQEGERVRKGLPHFLMLGELRYSPIELCHLILLEESCLNRSLSLISRFEILMIGIPCLIGRVSMLSIGEVPEICSGLRIFVESPVFQPS